MKWLSLLCLSLLLAGCGLGGGDEPTSDAPRATGDNAPELGRPADEEDAGERLGFPAFATKNTTRVGGADPIADAAGVARAVYPSTDKATRPRVVTLVDVDDFRSAISAAQLMSAPLRAPVLFTRGDEVPEATKTALEALDPLGADEAGKAQVIRIGGAAKPEDLKTSDVSGQGHAALARAIDRLHTEAAGEASAAVLVAPSGRPALAMPAAAYAAKAGVPVLWADQRSLPAPTRQAISSRQQPNIYVLGDSDAISDAVVDQLKDLGSVRRVSGPDPVRNAIAFARFSDGRFGWNVVDPGHGLVFASAERPQDAAAAAPLSATGKYGPLLLIQDARQLPGPLSSYLLDIQPGYKDDPVRGVYNHGWLVGDEEAVSVDVQSQIDALLEIQPVETGDTS